MSKKQVMISVDDEVIKLAISKGIIVSHVCEDALRLKLETKKSDIPEESIKMQCTRCKAIVDEGFLCEPRNVFFCDDCHLKCKLFNAKDGHTHLKVPGYDGENLNLVKRFNAK